MKKILIPMALLPMAVFGQKQDTARNYKIIDEVRIESRRFMNKTSEDIAKIPLRNIENPQVYSWISNVILKK